MKLNLLIDEPDKVLPGYYNIDPLAPDLDSSRMRADPSALGPIADAGEVEEIIAHDIIDTVPLAKVNALIDHWLSRLAHKGRITISCVDIMEVCRSLQNRLISVEEASMLLHGDQSKNWRYRQANYTLLQLVETLRAKGMKVLQKRVYQFKAFVVAERP